MVVLARSLLLSSGLLLLSSILSVQAEATGAAVRLRADLQKKSQFFCRTPKDIQAMWQAGVYDTLLSLRKLSQVEHAERLARAQAQREGGAGYAYGRCQDRRGWLVSVSAPYRVRVKGNQVKLAAGLQHYCRGMRARYAASSLQRTQVVPITKQHALALPQQGNGLVAVNCLSWQPHKTGPRLLYVFPVGQPVMRAPFLPPKVAQGQERQAVQAWVAALRTKMRLPALRPQKMPQTATRFSVIHNRIELYALKQILHQQKLHLLGENRARGHTLAEALTMLWVSPFHRQLLLHDAAAYLMVDVVRQPKQVLVTLLISRALAKHETHTETAKFRG